MINVLDLSSGNVNSVIKVLSLLNLPSQKVRKIKELTNGILIIPGVGSAGPYMDKLKSTGFSEAITDYVQSGNRVVGICLGFQLLSGYTEEDGGVEGLGLLKGKVQRLCTQASNNGWKKFYFDKKTCKSILNPTRRRIVDGRVYYNHEYGFISEERDEVDIKIDDSELNKYSAMIVKEGVAGFQFHPEKSQVTGFELMSMIL